MLEYDDRIHPVFLHRGQNVDGTEVNPYAQ